MSVDSSKIFIGAPDQETTGAVAYAAVGSTAPASATATLPSATWTDCGYVREQGVDVTPTFNTTALKDWSKNKVRTLLSEFSGTVSFGFIQTDYESLCAIFGADYVTKTDATQAHGEQITVSIGAHLAPCNAFCFSMKDGDARVRIYLPNAQPIINGSITFAADSPITWTVDLECNADANGHSIYIMTDDGVVSA